MLRPYDNLGMVVDKCEVVRSKRNREGWKSAVILNIPNLARATE